MEGQMDYEKYVELLSLALGSNGNVAPYVPEDYPNQSFLPEARTSENHSNAPPLPQWMCSQQTSHNYIEFLAENSTYDHNASFSDVPEGISLPVGGGIHHPNGVSEIESEVLNEDSGKAHSFDPTVSNFDMVSWNVMPSLHVPNSNNHEDLIGGAGFMYSGQNEIGDGKRCSVPMERYLKPHNEGKPLNSFTNPLLRAQINTTLREQANKYNYHVHEPQSGVKVAAPEIPSKPRYSSRVSKERTTETDRLRRLKIAEKLKALQELLPQSTEASQASVMDGVIEYIKYLHLQMKELCRSRLGGNSTSDPFISLERYGHNLINEQMQSEPPEAMIGNMLEVNPSAATQLLESRGLWVMPMAMAEDLLPGHSRMMPYMPI